MNVSSVIQQALQLWNYPPMTSLSPESIVNAFNRIALMHQIDLSLTPNAAFNTEVTPPFRFPNATDYEMDISSLVPDLSSITRVESRPAGVTDDAGWLPERIASFDNWNKHNWRGDGTYVAFYSNANGRFMRVNAPPLDTQYRIVYHTLLRKIDTPSDFLEMPPEYESLLVYDLALEFSELIDDTTPEFLMKKASKTTYLTARRAEAMRQADKWRRSQLGNVPTRRRPFNDRTTFAPLRFPRIKR